MYQTTGTGVLGSTAIGWNQSAPVDSALDVPNSIARLQKAMDEHRSMVESLLGRLEAGGVLLTASPQGASGNVTAPVAGNCELARVIYSRADSLDALTRAIGVVCDRLQV